MTLRDRVEGIIANSLKGEGPGWGDEHDVITKAVVEPILRFDTAYAVPTGGQPRDEFEVALDTWNKVRARRPQPQGKRTRNLGSRCPS